MANSAIIDGKIVRDASIISHKNHLHGGAFSQSKELITLSGGGVTLSRLLHLFSIPAVFAGDLLA